MIELPEAWNIAVQMNGRVSGRSIARVIAAHTPHKLAWYYGDRSRYSELLEGEKIGKVVAHGGLVEIKVGEANILLGEGVNIRFHEVGEERPSKHQFFLDLTDGTALSGVIQMYGGIGAFRDGELDNHYYRVAKDKPSPYSSRFDEAYFQNIISAPEVQKLSLKALLATEQRIPGLGNGVLQDILFNAKMHPKRKVSTIGAKEMDVLFNAIMSTLTDMKRHGGRDTEADLFGGPGGYRTILSKKTFNEPCATCGSTIKKEAYLGGNIYFCEKCQKL